MILEYMIQQNIKIYFIYKNPQFNVFQWQTEKLGLNLEYRKHDQPQF